MGISAYRDGHRAKEHNQNPVSEFEFELGWLWFVHQQNTFKDISAISYHQTFSYPVHQVEGSADVKAADALNPGGPSFDDAPSIFHSDDHIIILIIIAIIIISFIAIEAGALSPGGPSSDDAPSVHHYCFVLNVNKHYHGHY